MKNILPAIITLIVSISTSLAEPPKITSFKFEIQYNSGKIQEDIIADIYGDTLIAGIIPFQQSDFNLKATFTAPSAQSVTVNGASQQSTVSINNFSGPLSYVVTSAEGSRTYKVKLVYTGLPLVYVYTNDAAPIVNKEDYVSGVVRIYPNVSGAEVYSGTMGIRGRGNTTWTLPKKPYRIKLGTAASLLGMPSDKDWVLLANHSDKTLMRNTLTYDLGSQMSFAWTPKQTHVDLILNGVYQGNYVLGEHVKVDKDRVDIKELDETDVDPDKITGGYFMELDDYRDGVFFELGSGLPFVFKSPDEPTDAQLNYIRTYLQQTEDAIMSANFMSKELGYRKYIDTTTFIDWYWVNEVMKNIDAKDGSSIFYNKDRGGVLKMGPLWDFDVAAGNASVMTGDEPTGFYVRESKWFKRMFEDSVFRKSAEARWFTFKDDLLSDLPNMIDGYAEKLRLSQQYNFYKWDILNTDIWPSPTKFGSYAKEVEYLKEFMAERISWIDSQIEKPVDEPPVVTGVGDETLGVRTFPNPTTHDLFIDVPASTFIDRAELVDAMGRRAVSLEVTPGSTTKVDVSNLQRGMYVLILRGQVERPLTNKVVLK